MKRILVVLFMLAMVVVLIIPLTAWQNTPTIGVLPDNGPVLPATCVVGQIYFKTSVTTSLNQCLSANTWTAVGSGGTGTVTHTLGALTAGNFVLGNGGADIKDAGFSVVPPANGGAANITVSGQGYVFWPSGIDIFAAAGNTASGGAGGTVRCGLMMLDRAITFTKMSVNVTTAVNTNKIYLGVYNAAGTTLLVQGTVTMTASTGIYTATVASTTLTPSAYWWAFSTDNVSVVMAGNNNPTGVSGLAVINGNTVTWGVATNTLSGSTLPASLGVVSANAAQLPLVKIEP